MNQLSTLSGACCAPMARQLNFECADHPSLQDCPDAVVGRFGERREWGLYIHDGGSSHVEIAYCPWCGTKLHTASAGKQRSPVYEIAGGDVVLWSVDGTVHIKTTDRHNDPVELNEHQAQELAELLGRLVEDG